MPGPDAFQPMDMLEIVSEATMDQIEFVTEFVNTWLTGLGCSEHFLIQLDVAIDELFGNIVHYAYGSEPGPVTVRMSMEEDNHVVVITFLDQGQPFNPLETVMPDFTGLSAKKRPIGGMGLFMVKKTMDGLFYEYCDGKNILTIKKRIL